MAKRCYRFSVRVERVYFLSLPRAVMQWVER